MKHVSVFSMGLLALASNAVWLSGTQARGLTTETGRPTLGNTSGGSPAGTGSLNDIGFLSTANPSVVFGSDGTIHVKWAVTNKNQAKTESVNYSVSTYCAKTNSGAPVSSTLTLAPGSGSFIGADIPPYIYKSNSSCAITAQIGNSAATSVTRKFTLNIPPAMTGLADIALNSESGCQFQWDGSGHYCCSPEFTITNNGPGAINFNGSNSPYRLTFTPRPEGSMYGSSGGMIYAPNLASGGTTEINKNGEIILGICLKPNQSTQFTFQIVAPSGTDPNLNNNTITQTLTAPAPPATGSSN